MKVISRYTIRPARRVFYINATQDDIEKFYKGGLPEQIACYQGTFGTYGTPALFRIKKEDGYHKVIGIEFRPDDDRIAYPEELESILLSPTFFRLEEFIEELVNDDIVMQHVETLCQNDTYQHPFMDGKVITKREPEIVQIYISHVQSCVMIDAKYTPDEVNVEDEEARFKKLYYLDTTTGGGNWNYMWPRMSGYLSYGIQDFAFAYFDIKDFKTVNIVYGHLTANRLLADIDQKMNELDWVYFCGRCDNDNYAMMIKDMSQEETKEKLEAFFESVSHIDVDDNYKVYYRCGVVPMRTTIEMGNIVADAGKQAKAYGTKPYKTEIIFFTEKMYDEQTISTRLRAYLDTAIERDEFMIYLQPKYDISNNKIKGAEALIRWKYKGREMLSPGRFVPMFEEGGLIGKLDDIVLKKVCESLKAWEEQGKALYPISVNVSRKSVGIPGLVEHLTDIVDSYGVAHSLIDFELTESAAYDNQEDMIHVIASMKEKGFRTSMDDFGTGYSSLSLLPLMPFDTLKIDKSFVDRLGTTDKCEKSCSVVKHIISLAKDLNLVCLAEGAEEKEQVDMLREFGCEVVQGYYFSKPLPVSEYEKLL